MRKAVVIFPKSRMEIEMKERNSLDESLLENLLRSSCDKEISESGFKRNDRLGFYDFLPTGVFLM